MSCLGSHVQVIEDLLDYLWGHKAISESVRKYTAMNSVLCLGFHLHVIEDLLDFLWRHKAISESARKYLKERLDKYECVLVILSEHINAQTPIFDKAFVGVSGHFQGRSL